MSGHSKWSKIQHKKGLLDAKRGKVFSKLSREMAIVVKEGGTSDPNLNPSLRSIIERAKKEQMPKKNIENAIKTGGKGKNVTMERILYEAYGRGGVALLISIITDNKNRTVSEIRKILRSNGGNLAESGSVLWQFEKVGFVAIPYSKTIVSKKFGKGNKKKEIAKDVIFDEVTSLKGIMDVSFEEKEVKVYVCENDLHKAREELDSLSYEIIASGILYKPRNRVKADTDTLESINLLVEALEESEDVVDIWTNL